MAKQKYTVKYGDTKTKLKNDFGVGFDYGGYKHSNKDKLDVGEVIEYEDNVLNLDDIKTGVKPVNFVESTTPPPIIPNLNLTTPPPKVEAPISPAEIEKNKSVESTLLSEKTGLENEITALEQKYANTPQDKLDTMAELGMNEEVERLNEMKTKLDVVKGNLFELQDKGVTIPIEERQKYQDLGINVTSKDIEKSTFADKKQNALDQLATSREYSRFGSAIDSYQRNIDSNRQQIDEFYNAKKEQINFEYEGKLKRLNNVTTAYSDIITGQQAEKLQEREYELKVNLEKEKAKLKNSKNLASGLVESGLGGSSLMSALNGDDPNLLISEINKSMVSGGLDPKQAADLMIKAKGMRLEKAEKSEKAEKALDVKIAVMDSLKKHVGVLTNATKSDWENISGAWDQGDWTHIANAKSLELIDAMNHFTNDEVLTKLKDAGANPTDKDMEFIIEVVDQFNRKIDDNGNFNYNAAQRVVKKYTDWFDALKNKKDGFMESRMSEKVNKDIDKKRDEVYKMYDDEKGGVSNNTKKIEASLPIIKKFEGFSGTAYLDSVGVPTIGYGITTINGKPVKIGDTISEKNASDIMKNQINKKYTNFSKKFKVPMTPNQFSALTSLEYNHGGGIWDWNKTKPLIKAIENQDWKQASKEFQKFNVAGGKVNDGLTARRKEEGKLLLT